VAWLNKRDLAREAALFIADVYEVAGRLRRSGDALARPVGQSQARWQILSVISAGTWTVPRVAERLGVTRQNVQRITDELCADGLAELVPNERHARSPIVLLTTAGRRALETLAARAVELDASVGEAIVRATSDGFAPHSRGCSSVYAPPTTNARRELQRALRQCT